MSFLISLATLWAIFKIIEIALAFMFLIGAVIYFVIILCLMGHYSKRPRRNR